MTSLIMWIFTILAVLNFIQLPLTALVEGFLSFVTRKQYEGIGEVTFVAKHSLWFDDLDEDSDLAEFFSAWFLLDGVATLVAWFVLMGLSAFGFIWWILAAIAFTFGVRFILDITKDKEDD